MLRGVATLISDNLTLLKPLAINGKNSGQQLLTWAEFPMAEVRAIRASANVSVNDVMLAVLGGAQSVWGTVLGALFITIVP